MQLIRIILPALAMLFSATSVCHAEPYIEVRLKKEDKGSAVIMTNKIIAVALHSYRLNGSNEIIECTVDTLGNHSYRFYAMVEQDESRSAKAVRTALGQSRKLDNITDHLPARKFPEGAYSHNIEYQFTDPDKVVKFYKNMLSAWKGNAPCTVLKDIDE